MAGPYTRHADGSETVAAAHINELQVGIEEHETTKANASALTAHTGNTTNPHSVTKAQVGLGSVDNTSDAAKPISTAQQTALDAKAAGPAASVDGEAVLFSGATGKLLTRSALTGVIKETNGVQSVAVGTDLPAHTHPYEQVLYAKVIESADTIANTTALSVFGSSYVFTANSLTVGKVIRVTARGFYSTAATAPTLLLAVALGNVYLGNTGLIASVVSLANRGWEIRLESVVRSLGATGTVMSQGVCRKNTSTTAAQITDLVNTAVTTLDTTIARQLAVQIQWGTAATANTITMTELIVEEL
jgi:hypothetical protein